MATIAIPFSSIGADADSRAQLDYALTFISEAVRGARIDHDASTVELDISEEAPLEEIRRRAQELISRYEKGEFGLPKQVDFSQRFDRPVHDAWSDLLARRWVAPVGEGHVILRGLAAQLAEAINAKIDTISEQFHAEREIYPPTILCKTLDRVNHFTSFPEHVDFVSHLRRDLEVIDHYSSECREHGWSPQLHEGRMSSHDFAIAPSCCYHAYEGMEGWSVGNEGRSLTAILSCHRYEGGNHRTLARLRAFTMREIVWIGTPLFVMTARSLAEEAIVQWVKDWGLTCTLETANDMFFTDDYAIKASFQRQQQAKRELRVLIPFEEQSISCFSSNFHSNTFGKAFSIDVNGRPATSGCIGWGIERWVYAIFSQFGLDPANWPMRLQKDVENHAALC